MSQQWGAYAGRVRARPSSTTPLFGQVMFLVSVSIGFFALGAYVGRNLTYGAGLACEIGALVMLFAQGFVRPLRTGALGISWLYALALLLGIGLGPVLNYYTTYDQSTVYQAAGGTALTVAGMAAFGTLTSRDLIRWARVVSGVFLVAILISWVIVLVGTGGNVVLDLVIYAGASALLAINFQYLRRQADGDDAIWLATGIFVNIVNIFLALLSILSDNR